MYMNILCACCFVFFLNSVGVYEDLIFFCICLFAVPADFKYSDSLLELTWSSVVTPPSRRTHVFSVGLLHTNSGH